ncbi:hypothetical protein C2S53_006858 [Perilla frutescens var. hirtella]|uniref:Transposase MuDR plant domain-containing protein n=1 Tax=Perilla frutescens var. hirtella TaxID=608512 RepID=A0AAD4J209_PERFH|nr:hypothetical protein C2S53_006858 [Perilla frutescens var. hirtella]
MHGGMALNDSGKIMYLEVTMSAFDFVDVRKWSRMYLDGLCEQLGYMGTKHIYGYDEKGELKLMECEADFWYLIRMAEVSREFTLYLDGKKENIDVDGGEIVDGEVEYIDDEQTEPIEQQIETAKWLKKRYLQTYLVAEDVDNVRVVEELVDEDRAAEEESVDVVSAREAELGENVRAVETVLSDENVRAEEAELGENVRVAEVELGEQQEGFLEEVLVEQENIISNEKRKGKAILEEDFEFDSEDVDFSCDEDSCDELIDEIIYNENVDKDIEWMGTKAGDQAGEGSSSPSNETVERNPHFELGQIFSTKLQFKDVVNNSSVQEGRATKFVKNDTRRIYARCKNADEGCGWHLNALKVKNEEAWQIREIDLAHTCARQFHSTNAKSGWKDAISELGVYVSTQQAIKARQKLLKMIEGSNAEQYSMICDYADTLKEKNPGSTVILDCDVTSDGNNFKRFYVCLGSIKRGFKAGSRPWIDVDGCHLSVVSSENKEACEWFLQLVKDDLMTEREDVYTFMSDKKKGLIGAFETVLSGVENRFCVRYLHGNMKRAGFRGSNFKKLLWKAANATTVGAFNSVMLEIEKLDKNYLEWLQAKPSAEWSKSHFSTFAIEDQPDYPMSEGDEDASMFDFIDNFPSASTKTKPSTVQGRKQLAAKKRVHFASNIPERKAVGIQIRAPSPMSFHPNEFVGGAGGVSKGKEIVQESMNVFKEGGKKYVTLSGLKSALKKKKGAKV